MKRLILMISILILSINFYSIKVLANEDDSSVFIGVVKAVAQDQNGSVKKVLVDGYIKGNSIYKTKIIAIITSDTEVFIDKKPIYSNFFIQNGDMIYIVFSKSKSSTNPPQSRAKKIEIYKNENYKKLNENIYNIQANIEKIVI